MAIVTATAGKQHSFNGGANVLYCKLSQANREGVQIVAEGFNIEDATVTVIFPNGAEQQPIPLETENNAVCIVGRRFSMDGIRISDLPNGSYSVTFIQL